MADKTSEAWEKYLVAHPEVEETIALNGVCEVTAESIKQFREPRLMTKHDSIDGVPKPLAKRGINVLSASRSSYYLGDFNVFERFPDTCDLRPEYCELPAYETLDIEHISSESNAINALIISGILDKFLGEYNTVETFNGRMGTGEFDFCIDRFNGKSSQITVNNAQLEIDGGFENDSSVTIMEAKNVLHEDFNIRQLYYPFRKYRKLVKKPIRLVFAQYTNLSYNLFEYEFSDPNDFSSIRLLRKAAYTFEEDLITADNLWTVWKKTRIVQENPTIPFPQADRIDRILSLIEFLSGRPDGATTAEITIFMGTVERQAAYYPTAGRYLGLFEKPKPGITTLTDRAKSMLGKKSRSERLLQFAGFILEHAVFHKLYQRTLELGEVPNKAEIMSVMTDCQVLSDSTESMLKRRAGTVSSWLKWLFELPDDE